MHKLNFNLLNQILKYIILEWISGLAFSGDGKYLATGSPDKTVNLIDLEA